MISQNIPIVPTKNHIISRDFRLSTAPGVPVPTVCVSASGGGGGSGGGTLVEPWCQGGGTWQCRESAGVVDDVPLCFTSANYIYDRSS